MGVLVDARSNATPKDYLGLSHAGLVSQGHAALRVMAPRQTPILWPEHFDVAILLDDISYGASPGDTFRAAPYAYVSSSDRRLGLVERAVRGDPGSRADAHRQRSRDLLARRPCSPQGPCPVSG